MGTVWAAGDGVEPKPNEIGGIRFTPYPKDEPEMIAKGGDESVYLRPVDPNTDVYYRILSVSGADQEAPISTADVKVETRTVGSVTDYVPIKLTEDLVNADSLFVVKAATYDPKTSYWSENVTVTYKVVFGEHTSSTKLEFVSEVPAEFMVGESYEMRLRMTPPEDSLNRYGNTRVQMVINWSPGTGIDLAEVEYKFAEGDAWTALDEDDMEDLIRIPGTFRNFAENDVWVRLTMSRKKWSDEIEMGFSITKGSSFLDAVVLSEVIYETVPCVGRPATDPVFSPEAGYIAKGSAVTMTTTPTDAKIYYTTDGTEPTASSTEYTAPVTINERTAFKAIAITEKGTSFVSEAVYSVIAIPQVTPASGRVVFDTLVNITLGEGVPMEGVEIYYTTDGTEPTAENGTKYTAPFKLRATTLKVIAIQGADQSPVVTREYSLIPAKPTATPAAGKVPYGTKVKLECATEGADIYWRIGGGYGEVSIRDNKYTEEIEIKESGQLKAVAIYEGIKGLQASFTYTVTLSTPEFSIPSGVVQEGTLVEITSKSKDANTNRDKVINIAYTLDGSDPDRNSPIYTEPIELTEDVTIKAITWTVGTQGYEQSAMNSVTYTVTKKPVPTPVALTFDPASGSEVEEGTVVTITANQEVELFYMMFASEEAAKAAEWDQEKAASYSAELKPVLSKEQNTLKVAYALSADAESVEETFFYATYTIKEQPAIELTFNPAPGSEVEEGTKV
ncbi:MAG: chitobiase/beta-hexosaminidase C-terminal domain-containing protein, partial [Bacteroidales bacterium]|nr:chitobiase/beta-hexosaminidase C-terminal domain-containing protein [Bacteroidales bacterium]